MVYRIGQQYSRRDEIHAIHGGQQQGGISTPAAAPFIFLFTGETGEQFGYEDGWQAEQGIFLYTGEGQSGDMAFIRGNRQILDHTANGKELLLFKALGKGKPVEFLGMFSCASWDYIMSPDVNGSLRNAIQFHLIPHDLPEETGGSNETDSDQVPNHNEVDLDELRRLAYAAMIPGQEREWRTAKQILRQRNANVRNYVLARANGCCELTGKPAPFIKKNGTPYLEVHHLIKLSDHGLDNPKNCAAITPDIHREIHFGLNGAIMNNQLKTIVAAIEEDL